MPAPLIHIAYGKKFLELNPGYDELKLMRGTAFADIRRMANLDRDLTHRYDLKYEEVLVEKRPWQAGMLLHSYLDDTWNKFFEAEGLMVGEFDHQLWMAAKHVEEVEFADHVSQNEHLARLFESPPLEEELAFNVSSEGIERWNRFMIWKLRLPNTIEDWERQATRIGYTPEQIQRVNEHIAEIRGSERWMQLFDRLHTELGM